MCICVRDAARDRREKVYLQLRVLSCYDTSSLETLWTAPWFSPLIVSTDILNDISTPARLNIR